MEPEPINWRSMWQTLSGLPNPYSLKASQVNAAISYALAILDATHPEAALAAKQAILEGRDNG